jgi:predicted metal-dependent hydrolase
VLALVGTTTVSLLRDPTARRHPVRLARSVAKLRRSPFVTRDVARRIRDYNRPGFHPDDHDAAELVERWRSELFGADGSLTPRVKSA